MAQEITITKVEDHYKMQFGGGSAYPVPAHAIESLDDDLTPEKVGDSVTFEGDYGGHKHMKTFDVENVIEVSGDEEVEDGDKDEGSNEPTEINEISDCGEGDIISRGTNEWRVIEVNAEGTLVDPPRVKIEAMNGDDDNKYAPNEGETRELFRGDIRGGWEIQGRQ